MTQLSKPAALALLWLWAGAALMLLVTTATLFNTDVLDSRELSGAIAGAVLKRFFSASYYVLGACALISLLGWIADLKTRRKMELLFFLSLILLGANVVQDKIVRTRLVRIKLEIKNAPDPKRLAALQSEFNDWHRVSTSVFGGSLLLSLLGAGFVGLTAERRPSKKSA